MSAKYDLAQTNYHAAPGDILLLKSSDKGALNRTGQWIKRRREARFTHVAVVVDATKIVDAMPKIGVTFRVWRDIEAKYDIGASRVARHRRLAGDPKVRAQVYRSALYFVKQPYKLHTVVRESGRIVDQSGMVCSHFVAALMERLGVRVSKRRPTSTLPVDIDDHTRSSGDLRQFELRESALFSGAASPSGDDPYWDAAHEAVYSQLSEEDRAKVDESRLEALTKIEISGDLNEVFRLIAQADDVLAKAKTQNAEFEKRFAETIELQYNASRTLAAFESIMLALTEGLANGSEEALKVSMALLESDGLLGGKLEPITGAGFLAQWDALYRKEALPPIFLHEENTAENRERHRAILDRSVKRARELAVSHLQMFDNLTKTVQKISDALKVMVVPPELLAQVADAAEELRESAWYLRGETVDVVGERVDKIGERSKELVEWAQSAWALGSGMDRNLILRAGDTFHEICRYDLDTVNWLRFEPILTKWITALRP